VPEKERGMWLAQVGNLSREGTKGTFELYMVIEAENRQDAEQSFRDSTYGHLLDEVQWTPPCDEAHAIVIEVPDKG